ncbi:PTS sugar transporter subunit IIA [uncultured Dubosiella sp.]|uniref:PTS sugar transporter subunit IIA n=1 Tax=uncultured Dubosiella sp. TaxID=1937011 RepID=UPI00263622AA|nr:PTS sugar transporter subunit IIA [uncultured Dubosiella sp.]
MVELIQEKNIFLNKNFQSKNDVLNFISNKAAEYEICDSAAGLYEDLQKREQEFSTGLQDGFAIPHARSSHIKDVSVFFIKSSNELEWETLDDSKVKYFFALLVPEKNEGNIHLQMISQLATCLLEDDFKNKIKTSDSQSELKEYILSKMAA